MTAHRGHQLRRIGWLLTPLVVWAASFLGAWAGAVIAARVDGPAGGIGLMVVGAVATSIVAVVVWVLVLRRGVDRDTQPNEPVSAPTEETP